MARRFLETLLRLSDQVALAPRGLARVDRLALAACIAGGGSGAAVVLSKLFCL